MGRMTRPIVLVLASGRGERFIASGGEGSKLQALLAGKPVLEHTLDAVRASGLPYHLEDGSHPGMGDSIAAAVRATRDAPGWLILPGDLPLVKPTTLLQVADALASQDAAVPLFQGQRGHPVGFAARCGAGLAALEGKSGAQRILSRFPAIELIVDDAGCVADIDTLDDLARAEALIPSR